MIKTKFVILSKFRFSNDDKVAIMNALKDLYKKKGIEDSYVEEKNT